MTAKWRSSAFPPVTTLLDCCATIAACAAPRRAAPKAIAAPCTVVLEREGRRDAVNACIVLLGQLDGQSVRTVEGLRAPGGGPHPVQVAMAEADATQCGFCTPGFVMSALAHASNGGTADPKRSTKPWRAISAAAPATGRSSRR